MSGVLKIEFQVASDLRRVLEAVLMSGVLRIGFQVASDLREC